jgi:Cas10/Cmr2, second palm domain
MTYYLYLFEAHTIQPFIFESGRLAEMVGASELIEDLFGKPLDTTLEALEIEVKPSDYIRRGGAAWTLKMDSMESAMRLRDAWGLIITEKAPGLPFSHTVCQGSTIPEALAQGRGRLEHLRNYTFPRLPVPGPLVQRSPRTGNPAVLWEEVKKNRWEWIDEATQRKRQKVFRKGVALNNKFLSKDTLDKFTFPLNLEPDEEDAFPFESDNHYVAIIHADGNGLGEELIRLSKKLEDDPGADSASIFRELSNSIKSATEAAAKEALLSVFDNADSFPKSKSGKFILPFRPLVLGGDDMTVIIRAEHALEFINQFIHSFEEETKTRLTAIESPHVPDGLTACAGICFVKVNQPFYLGYQLAESLCGYAKSTARRNREKNRGKIPSAVAFHRVTTSFVTDYETVQQEEMRMSQDENIYYLTMGAYGAGQYSKGMPPLIDLLKMKSVFQKPAMSRGPLRHFLTLLHAELADARKAYKRWVENMEKDKALSSCLDDYRDYTTNLFGGAKSAQGDDLPFQEMGDSRSHRTFIGDLMQLIAVEGEAHDH